MSAIYILVAVTIDDAAMVDSSIDEPSASETEWVSGGTYVEGDVRIRTTSHRKYRAVDGHTGVTTLPEDDVASVHWVDIGPTDRWAAFDIYVSTPSLGASPVTYVLHPGNFDGIWMGKLVGETVTVQVLDEPAGAEIFPETVYTLVDPPLDWWDWAFGAYRSSDKLVLSGIPPSSTAELRITIAGGTTCGAGMISIGDFRDLTAGLPDSGPLAGASAEPKTLSGITIADDGTLSIVRRRSGTDNRVEAVIAREASDYCLATLQEVLDVPCAVVASRSPGYAGLNVFGLVSASLVYLNAKRDLLTLTTKGIV